MVAANDVYSEFHRPPDKPPRSRCDWAMGWIRTSDMGPVISQDSRDRILTTLDDAASAGARLVDRWPRRDRRGPAQWLLGRSPRWLTRSPRRCGSRRKRCLVPVVSLQRVGTLREAMDMIEASPFGNAASIYTSSGARGSRVCFRRQHRECGRECRRRRANGVFPVRRAQRQSFFGDLHGQAGDAVRFFTDPKVVVSRWPRSSDGRDPWD